MSGGGGETERASESGPRFAWAGAIPFDEARLGRVTPDSAVDDAIVTIPPGGRANSRNEGAERILGWGEHEIVGRPAAPFFTDEDDDRDRIGTEMRPAREEGPAADERYHGREDGSRFHAQGLMMPPRGPGAGGANGPVGFVTIFRDLTDRHESWLLARHLAESVTSAAHASPSVGVYRFDPASRTVRAGGACACPFDLDPAAPRARAPRRRPSPTGCTPTTSP